MIQLIMEVFRCVSAALCLLEIIATQKIKQEVTLHVHSEAASITYARVNCMKYGATCRLPIYQTDEEILSVQSKMKVSGINMAWLSINKKRYHSWEWLDETRMDPEFEAQHWRDYMRCGTLHLRDRILEADNCTIGYYGYVCLTKDLDWCVRGQVPSSRCIKLQKKIYILGCFVDNWYDAKYQCERRGMTLATNLNREVVEYLSKQWYGTKRCNQVWVGFRKDDWVLRDHVSSDKPFRYFWGQGQPQYDKDCAVITRNNKNMFSWSAVSCSASKTFLCVCPRGTREALPRIPGSTSESLLDEGSSKLVKITWIIIICIVLTFAAVMGFIFLMIKRKSSMQQMNSESGKLTEGEISCHCNHAHQEDDYVVMKNKENLTKEGYKENYELQQLSIEESQQLTMIRSHVEEKNTENNNEQSLSTTEAQDLDENDETDGEQKPKHVSLCYMKDKADYEDYVII